MCADVYCISIVNQLYDLAGNLKELSKDWGPPKFSKNLRASRFNVCPSMERKENL
jgi:hypothetical protein